MLSTMTDRAYAFTINQAIEKSTVDSLISECNSIEDAVYKTLSRLGVSVNERTSETRYAYPSQAEQPRMPRFQR